MDGRHHDQVQKATSTPFTTWLVRGLVVVLAGVVAGWMLYESWVRLQVDTAVEASAVGRDGCITAATFTGPDEVLHLVDVRVYKANCRNNLEVGDPVTVWYDSSDPGRHAADRRWWLYLGLAAGPLLLAGWVMYRTARPAVRREPRPYAVGGPPLRDSAPPRGPPRGPHRRRGAGTQQASLWQLADIIERLEEEVSRLREQNGPDQHVLVTLTLVRRAHGVLESGQAVAAREVLAEAARSISDSWRDDSGWQILEQIQVVHSRLAGLQG